MGQSAPVKIKATDTPAGRLVWRRFDVDLSFHCDECERDHTSRTVAELRRPGAASTRTLCNGCYGELLSTV